MRVIWQAISGTLAYHHLKAIPVRFIVTHRSSTNRRLIDLRIIPFSIPHRHNNHDGSRRLQMRGG